MGEIRSIVRPLAAAGLAVALVVALQAGGAHAGEQIIGGTRASTAQHPYVVYLAKSDGFQFCGGTLIGAVTVVTAAHCVVDQSATDLRVVAGRDDKHNSNTGVVVAVKRMWVHPNFTHVRGGSDIAVLTVSKRLRYRPAPVAGPGDTQLYQAGKSSTILGWGRTTEGGSTSRYLLAAAVPVVSDADCRHAYADYSPNSMVCAGFSEGGVDTCQGDSGGPMMVDGKLVGIASWGDGCARPGRYGVYTRVASYAGILADHL
jgi:trypsin